MQRFLWPLRFLLLCCATSGHGQENLIINPGFEEAPAASGKPAGGWWLYEARGNPNLKLDRTVAHGGAVAARIHSTNDAKATLVSPHFAVAPGDEIQFEGWARGENLPPSQSKSYVGVAFRRADGNVFGRTYVESEPLGSTWSRIAGTANVPDQAASAEIHLGYTNAPGTVWFDDVAAVITNPLSLSLVADAKPWPGEQEIALLVANRGTNRFQGSVSVAVGGPVKNVPVILEPNSKRELKVPITLAKVGAHNYKLTLLDSARSPVRSLQGKFHTRAPVVLYPACPCYHAVGEGNGDTRIDAAINLSPAQRAGLRLAVEVTDADGKTVKTAEADASTGETAGLNVRVPVRTPGVFEVSVRLLDRAGKELAQASTDVHVAPREDSRVQMGPDGFLRIAGKPNFPIGLYSSSHYEEMGKAGFTATHNYGITTGEANDPINANDAEVKQLLDKSLANGMRMMVELPRKAIEKAQWPQVRRRVETFRYHPGLLCWGSEERVARGTAPLANIAALYRLVHQLDPNHPLVLGDTKDVIQKFATDRSDFFPDPYMDAGIWWWYPIPLRAPDGNGLDGREKASGLLEPPSWLITTISRKPLWIAIQSYQQPRKDAPFPTPAQYRAMAYLSIINGVKALWFYTGSGQKDWQGKPAGLLNKPEEAHWDYVQKLVAELRGFSPVIMSPPCADKPAISPAGAHVEFATRELGGKLYLIAASKSPRPESVRFTGIALKGKHARVLYETHTAAIEGDSLQDDFTPFGVHVYQLD